MIDLNEPVLTGTTIIAMKFDDGVIIGADSRTSAGRYVMNRVTNKLTQLTPKIYGCVSGRAAHTQAVNKYAQVLTESYALQEDREPYVHEAANAVHTIIYENPGLVASMIVAGYDEKHKGSIYSINIGGTILEREWVMSGSGSIFLYGHCDKMYRNDMTFEEKFNLVKELVKLAIGRDNSSGGCIRMAVIKKEGVENHFIPGNEL